MYSAEILFQAVPPSPLIRAVKIIPDLSAVPTNRQNLFVYRNLTLQVLLDETIKHSVEQLLDVVRLLEVIIDTKPHGTDDTVHVAISAENDDDGLGVLPFGSLKNLQATDSGHGQIGYDQIKGFAVDSGHRLLAAASQGEEKLHVCQFSC